MTDLGYSTNLVASRIVNRNMNFLQNLTAQTTVVGTIAGVYITAEQST